MIVRALNRRRRAGFHRDRSPGDLVGRTIFQSVFGSRDRAQRFYDTQMLDHLNPTMREFIGRQEMVFVATADSGGHCDATFRAGPPGFVTVLDERRVAWPEYRGNGVLASLGDRDREAAGCGPPAAVVARAARRWS